MKVWQELAGKALVERCSALPALIELLSVVQIYDNFIYECSFILHLRDKYELSIDQLPVGLITQLVRALHRYRRVHGFDSRSSLNFFRFLLLNCLS